MLIRDYFLMSRTLFIDCFSYHVTMQCRYDVHKTTFRFSYNQFSENHIIPIQYITSH